ncbi:hypothetical protein EDB80DRAFT_698294 [Ilyonectria destructans]|nr:hypothetical protein EDB80DRAFT_698294 [Ilyonectria destructans]
MGLGLFGATLRWGCIWPILHLGNGELAHGDRIFAKGHVPRILPMSLVNSSLGLPASQNLLSGEQNLGVDVGTGCRLPPKAV